MPNFGPFPSQNTNAVQQDFLEKLFLDSLHPVLAYRHVATKEAFPARIGESITMTKAGLMVPDITPLDPTTNTNIDNGMTPTGYGTEQYTLRVAQYPTTAPDVNTLNDQQTIASFAVRNTENLAINIATKIDTLARNDLFNTYMGGNTVVTATLGSPGTVVQVDDIRGFQTLMVNGNLVPVSGSNTLEVLINGDPYLVSGFAADVSNVSSAAIVGGISGTITTTTNVSTTNATAGNKVLALNAPAIVRPTNRASTDDLISTDLLNLDVLLAATTYLRNQNVMPVKGTGMYHCMLNSTSMSQVFRDPAFQLLYRGQGLENTPYRRGIISQALGVVFFENTQAPVQRPQLSAPVPVLQTIQRPIVCGEGALVEGVFTAGLDALRANKGVGTFEDGSLDFENTPASGVMTEKAGFEGCYMYVRPPIDRLNQIRSQTVNYIGGFVTPPDSLTNSTVISTASDADFKRAVIIETA